MITVYPFAAPTRTATQAAWLDHIDGAIRSIATSLGALEMHYPSLIARTVLDVAEYPKAFPHLLMSAARLDAPASDVRTNAGDDADSSATPWCLSPAVCYHAYAQLSGVVINEPIMVTARGRCFRAEQETTPGLRQAEFDMREIVLVGDRDWIDGTIEVAKAAVESAARGLDLPGDWETAEDPFFLPAAAGQAPRLAAHEMPYATRSGQAPRLAAHEVPYAARSGPALMQRLLKVKLEYQWPRAGGLALASINRHGAFFGERFHLLMADGQLAHTACVAVGLDRWAHLGHAHAHSEAAPASANKEAQS